MWLSESLQESRRATSPPTSAPPRPGIVRKRPLRTRPVDPDVPAAGELDGQPQLLEPAPEDLVAHDSGQALPAERQVLQRAMPRVLERVQETAVPFGGLLSLLGAIFTITLGELRVRPADDSLEHVGREPHIERAGAEENELDAPDRGGTAHVHRDPEDIERVRVGPLVHAPAHHVASAPKPHAVAERQDDVRPVLMALPDPLMTLVVKDRPTGTRRQRVHPAEEDIPNRPVDASAEHAQGR